MPLKAVVRPRRGRGLVGRCIIQSEKITLLRSYLDFVTIMLPEYCTYGAKVRRAAIIHQQLRLNKQRAIRESN